MAASDFIQPLAKKRADGGRERNVKSIIFYNMTVAIGNLGTVLCQLAPLFQDFALLLLHNIELCKETF